MKKILTVTILLVILLTACTIPLQSPSRENANEPARGRRRLVPNTC